jgi:glutamate-1-semialdehyde 2,1-aminomutase
VVSKKILKKKSIILKKTGEKLIAGLAQTAAKKPTQFSVNFSPVFLQSGHGSIVKDLDNNYFLDTIMGIGPLILGYNNDNTNQAVKRQLKKGIVFSLINPLEVELAKILKKNIPNMDMFRFSKTGGDITSAAIRAARNYKQKNKILSCGYHGWHDWNAISLSKNSGIPLHNKNLIKKIQYNNIDQIADSIDSDTAAIILEPLIFEMPKNNFLEKVRKITKQKKILLIFDEMWTGFRLHIGGAQKYFNIDADMACYSKAIANGMPISVLAGKNKIMRSLDKKSFFYTTFSGEALSIAAAISTIKYIKKYDVCSKIQIKGYEMMKKINEIIKNNNCNFINVSGYGARTLFTINNDPTLIIKTFIHQEMLKNKILWNGIINLSYSHTQQNINNICEVFDKILKKINKISISKLSSNLEGKKIEKFVL